MSLLYRLAPSPAPLNSAFAAMANTAGRKLRDTEPFVLFWWIFTACVAASQIAERGGEALGPLYYLLTVAGSAGCGWMWMLSRSLFRSDSTTDRWAIFLVGAIVIVESYWHFTSGLPASGLEGELRRIGENSAALVCFGAIAMVFVEALSGYGARLPKAERRFRQFFVSAFGAVIVVAIVWASNTNEMTIASQWSEAALAGCALIAIVASRLAVNFRLSHPLATAPKEARSRTSARNSADGSALGQRILTAVEDREIFATPNLKVSQFAKALGEQEYKVTQCITGRLGFRNFNQFINSYRIESAKLALASAEQQDRPILSIAFDCGFGSIGPFNRAFKEHVGMTPREYRATHGDVSEPQHGATQ